MYGNPDLLKRWRRKFRSLPIELTDGEAPQFWFGNWTFAISKVHGFRAIVMYKGKRHTAQPELPKSIAEYGSFSDKEKGWVCRKFLSPEEIVPFLQQLVRY